MSRDALLTSTAPAPTRPPEKEGRRMVTVREACQRLDESPSYFYRASLPHLRWYKLGRATRIEDASIDELIEKRLAANPKSAQRPRRGRPRKVVAQGEPVFP